MRILSLLSVTQILLLSKSYFVFIQKSLFVEKKRKFTQSTKNVSLTSEKLKTVSVYLFVFIFLLSPTGKGSPLDRPRPLNHITGTGLTHLRDRVKRVDVFTVPKPNFVNNSREGQDSYIPEVRSFPRKVKALVPKRYLFTSFLPSRR